MKEEEKTMRIPDEPDLQGEINIIPMIDVIFSILAFFIISSLYLTRSEGLPVNLPSAQTAEVKQTSQINITVEQDGDIFLDRQPIGLDSLIQSVDAKIPENETVLVVINADEAVSHGIVVQVMDRLRQVDGATLAIAAKKPK
jgi:biopolymer transport protein ExbD